MIGWIRALLNYPCPSLQACKYVTSVVKDTADVMELSVLWWGDHTEWPGWAQCPHKGPCSRRAGEPEKVGRSRKLRSVGSSRSQKRRGSRFSSEASRRSPALLTPQFYTSDFQNCKRVHLCWVKLPNYANFYSCNRKFINMLILKCS